MTLPVLVSHRLAVLSLLAVTIFLPSGLNEADNTMDDNAPPVSVWSWKALITFPVLMSHNFAVLSWLAVSI